MEAANLQESTSCRWLRTYSYQFRPEIVFDHLEKQLAAHGVTLRPRSDAECLDMLRGSEIVTETAVLFAALVPIIREHGLGHASRSSGLPASLITSAAELVCCGNC